MTQNLIDEIFTLKAEAVKQGFDWPTHKVDGHQLDQDDAAETPNEILELFLQDLKDFFERGY